MSETERATLEEQVNGLEGTSGFRTGGYTSEQMLEITRRIRAAREFNARRALDVQVLGRFATAATRAIQREVATKRQLDTSEDAAQAQVEQVMQQRDQLDSVFNLEPKVPQPEAPAPPPAPLALEQPADDAGVPPAHTPVELR